MSHYNHGEQAWAEVAVPDVAEGMEFYAELSGWDSEAMGAGVGLDALFSQLGKPTAALRAATSPGSAEWLTYFSADVLDAVAQKVKEAGGSLVVPPKDTASVGRMAVFADTPGAAAAAWQPGGHLGAALRAEPGAYIASEVGSPNLAKSMAFSSEVFGSACEGSPTYPEGLAGARSAPRSTSKHRSRCRCPSGGDAGHLAGAKDRRV